MTPATTIELLMHQHPPVGVWPELLGLLQGHPGCGGITADELADGEGIHLRRQTSDRTAAGAEIRGPQRSDPRHEQKQHQGQRQGRHQQLKTAPQQGWQRTDTTQFMGQQARQGGDDRQQLQNTGQQTLHLDRQQTGGDQLQQGNQPVIGGAAALPTLEHRTDHQPPGGPGQRRGEVEPQALQQQDPAGHARANRARQASRWRSPVAGATVRPLTHRP